jgi:hypothetical protein
MPTTSSGRGLSIPGPAGDTGAWGGILTLGFLDAILAFSVTFPSSTYGTAATVTSSQAQNARLVVNNTSSQAFQLNLPAYEVAYSSSQNQALTITAGSSGGSNVVLPDGSRRMVFSDGVNITLSEGNLPTSSFAVARLRSRSVGSRWVLPSRSVTAWARAATSSSSTRPRRPCSG